ncbi:MAG: PadR family transcriptional regulator, partial [Pseudomonadota bacterium]
MNVRTLILAILNKQDASGYEIKKLSSEGRFSYFVDISFGSIYPTLARLEEEGNWIPGDDHPNFRGGPVLVVTDLQHPGVHLSCLLENLRDD